MKYGGLAIEPGNLPLSQVELMPDVLQWGDLSRTGLDVVFDTYAAFVTETSGFALHDCERRDKALADDLAAKLQTVPTSDALRVLLSPDFTSRLLWRHPDRVHGVCAFLGTALHVERVLRGKEEASCDAWTVLGDTKVLRSGEILRGAGIPGLPALDFDSPCTATDEFGDPLDNDQVQFRSLSDDVRPVVLARMAAAWHEISATSELIADFVAKFVQVFVLRSNNARAGFSSGSYRRFIGRAVFGNPHCESASEITLAEAMVHEAIHALLYMTVYSLPWGVENNRTFTGERIISPWTGAPLKSSSFLQACFVWYGLLHFWNLALRAEAFTDAGGAHSRTAKALKGFVCSPLLDNLCREDRKVVSDDVSNAIETMQSRVKAGFRLPTQQGWLG